MEAAAEAAQGKKLEYRIVDPHVHVWKRDKNYPWAKETKSPPEEDASPEMLLELMRNNGVSKRSEGVV